MVFSVGGRVGSNVVVRLLGDWTGGRRPRADALRDALRGLVLEGQLPPGTRLPAERAFAAGLGVSRNLVTSALDELRELGFVESRRGAGSWTSLPSGDGGSAGAGGWYPPGREDVVNFAQGTPEALPEVFGAVSRAQRRFTAAVAGHGYNPQGLRELRERIAERFEARGLATTPDQVMITNGAQHAFALILRSLVTPGERVLVEQPTYPNSLEAIRGMHARPVAVPMVDGYWDLDLLEATLDQGAPRLAYLIPDFQNPTGARMSERDRERLGAALKRHRTTAVVDETMVELDLSTGPAPPPQAAFAESEVVTVGSASKVFWGGLRLGWIRAPREFVRRLVAGRAAVDMGSPVLEQLVLSELLEHSAESLPRRREQLRSGRDRLVSALGEWCPEWTYRVPEGGMSLWCDTGGQYGSRLVTAAERHGVRLASPSRFAVEGELDSRLRLPYTLPAEVLEDAVGRIARAAAELSPETEGVCAQLVT
ncbi:PLP-dependent aminotransferase family protein [Actinopolyspora saharensis]|uniref:MocR-like transcription factor YczR n=1 Tax=Actinopolyspora saharensis TaxID=995062 RepID=UPI003F661D92